MTSLRSGTLSDLTARELHAILKLRVDVFVVEQQCPYPDVDDRDAEPTTVHMWLAADDGRPLSVLRILQDPDAAVIGRVATARDARGHGYAARLVAAALERIGDGPVRIGAQAYLEEWYQQFGFQRTGPNYLEDDIPHLPMRRPGTAG
ncbi:GNAT family N-acetyltransferase [Nocardioides sp. 616]|uniref:GNAT family N-acetyltransferase n=1 Tax=Nocardioides sp. 616 TaxID=2268090 RepID=UPI000CE4BE79|nr:GNAT family N-acetyltransferase [Nocardioides sp. 616]